MPDHLEYVVRPSQSKNIRPGTPTQIFAPVKVPENEPITWGNAGNSVFDLHAHTQQELPMPEFPESQRSYDVVRVFNPDDETQFVDTEQMTEYRGRNKINGNRITLKFMNHQDTGKTQVISQGNIRKNPANPDDGQ